MTRRFQKSVGPSVCNAKKDYSSFIIDSRKIIRISGERAYRLLQENETIFEQIFEKLGICIKIPASPSLLIVE